MVAMCLLSAKTAKKQNHGQNDETHHQKETNTREEERAAKLRS